MHTAALREHGAMADAGAESHTVRGIDGPMGGARAAAPARRPGWGDSDAMDDGTLTFAALLKRHRRAAGLSQEALAARAGYSAVYVGMVERGQRRPPAATVELLAHALTLSPAERATFERAAARAPALAAPDDGLLTPFPALAPLPVVPTPLLGREAAVAEATALLEREGVRLLTLTGPGGVGKTRLAIRLAEVVADRHPGGVHFVDLSALADPALFLSTLARALDVRGAPRDALIAALRGRRVLLVLDNMEQVAAAGPALADVFAHCPEPTALVTSRVPLRVRGEHIFPVPPLALPDAAAAAGDIDALAGVAAVRLFMQRARSMRPDVALTPATAPDVVALCQALDGLPLALERAAARCRLLSPRELRARLAGGLGTLGDGPRDAPARQRTLEATVAWSEGLLDARERRLFRWFSVAAGGCALAAVEALGVAAGIPAGEVLDAASALVDHGLVRRDEGPDGDTRLLLLETPRVYGVRQLARGGEEGAARRVHAACAPPTGVFVSPDPAPLSASSAFDPTQRMGRVHQRGTRRGPGGVLGVERGAEVGPGQPLDRSHSLGVLVGRLGRIVSRNSAEDVLSAKYGEQALGAGTQDVRIGTPIHTIGESGVHVSIARDHEGWRRHLGEAGVPQDRVVLSRGRAEIGTPTGCGEQHTRLDPGIGHIHVRPVVGIGDLHAQQQSCRMSA